MFRERLRRVFLTNKIMADCVAHYLSRAKVLNCDPLETKLNLVHELNNQ